MASESIPWLTNQLMGKILKTSENDPSIEIISVNVKPATNKGDNYTSDMYRATVQYSHVRNNEKAVKDTTVIVKVAPTKEGPQKDIVTSAGLFETEISMMSSTLKEMNGVLQNKNPLSGKGLYGQEEEPVFLVMEDLAPLGFRMANRQNGLDLKHCILAIRGLARFHAASIAVCEKNPKLKTEYVKGIFNAESEKRFEKYGNFFNDNAKALAAIIPSWPELDPKYADKLMKISGKLYKLGIKASESREGDFNVIIHGDYWVNNMLFKYDNSGEPISHIMVDFQLCKYTSPAADLLYFCGTSMSDEIYFKHKDAVLEEYHKALCATMKQIGTKTEPLSLQKLHQHLSERAIIDLISSLSILPVILLDKDKVQSLDEMISKEGLTNPGLHSQRFRQTIAKRFPSYEKLGLFDL